LNNIAQIARIPELDTFDEAAFDCNPLWSIGAAPMPAVLIVDDDPAIAELLHRLLRSLVTDYTIIMETNPAALLGHLQGRVVPLVITDFSMPQMNGLDLTTQIKAHSPQTRVLLVSAFASRSLERQALTQQVDFYLPKPFQFENLEHVITTALKSR
jgi:two-component system, response regulator, stage 0 sporulation protein F